jgi:pilus assembly protein TadC
MKYTRGTLIVLAWGSALLSFFFPILTLFCNITIVITLSTVIMINIRERYVSNRRSDVEAVALEEVEMEIRSTNERGMPIDTLH